jgi:hypothetical protein
MITGYGYRLAATLPTPVPTMSQRMNQFEIHRFARLPPAQKNNDIIANVVCPKYSNFIF